MHPAHNTSFWKTAPLIRILLPLAAGIILQWYVQFQLSFILLCITCFFISTVLILYLQLGMRFLLRPVQGIILHLLVICIGMLLTWQKDVRHSAKWYGHHLTDSSVLLIKINEPVTEKSRSNKADGIITSVINGNKMIPTWGKVLIYFSKDSFSSPLHYGEHILVNRSPQPITNSGNPGAFNYKRYAAFQLLHHQLFLKRQDWTFAGKYKINAFQNFLYNTRSYVVHTLRRYIKNNNQQLGIAEALLIGYKEDLDKDLVQAYSNTGVVHIIAISGLHLGLIFFVLNWMLNFFPVIKQSKYLKAILLISGLWLFALLTGGAASVLRSAVMFTVVVIGTSFFKKTSIYNSLAASAFILLCYNPYYLWDVGFQLSYLAVGGIIFLQSHIYRMWYLPNLALRKIWNLLSVTIAAQIAAFPICLYYFHQFPNLFLAANLLVLPLATIALYGGVLLILLSPLPMAAAIIGKTLTLLLGWMNSIINFFNGFSFSVADGIYANIYTTWLLYAFIICLCGWLLHKNKVAFRCAVIALVGFSCVHAHSKYELGKQRKIVIYNISKCKAIDFIDKNKYCFVGDSTLQSAGLLQNFHLKPARIFFQATAKADTSTTLMHNNYYWQFHQVKLVSIDSTVHFPVRETALPIDILVLSKNAAVKIADITQTLKPKIIVLDASNNLWKIQEWKKECEQLLLRCHAVSEQGAFVLNAYVAH